MVDQKQPIELELTDLGDAMEETKQTSPVPRVYPDYIFGMGRRPNS